MDKAKVYYHERTGWMLKDEAWKIVKQRTEAHQGQQSQRIYNKGQKHHHEWAGFNGEWAFAKASGAPMDLEKKMRGDKGVDFEINEYKIDVKTVTTICSNPDVLWVEVKSCKSDIVYVMASFNPDGTDAVLIGWEYGKEVMKWPVVVSHVSSRKNYSRLGKDLNHMWYLAEIIIL